jgi:hypothetical protein
LWYHPFRVDVHMFALLHASATFVKTRETTKKAATEMEVRAMGF